MRSVSRYLAAFGLLAVGYVLGDSGFLTPRDATAQQPAAGIKKETVDKIKLMHEAITGVLGSLQTEGRYQPAIKVANSYAATCGGVNALQDLETGPAVDPETFAGLYAGLAVDTVAEHLDRDEQGRLTYKNKVIRLYSVDRLQRLQRERDKLAGIEEE